jgi:hypothetical protein
MDMHVLERRFKYPAEVDENGRMREQESSC